MNDAQKEAEELLPYRPQFYEDVSYRMSVAAVAARLKERDERFAAHTKVVREFINELYATMIDPLAEGEMKIGDMTTMLLNQARKDRESLAELADLRAQLAEAERRWNGEIVLKINELPRWRPKIDVSRGNP